MLAADLVAQHSEPRQWQSLRFGNAIPDVEISSTAGVDPSRTEQVLDLQGSKMSDFPSEDFKQCCGERWKAGWAGTLCCVSMILVLVLIPTSLGKVSSTEVALGYDKIHSSLSDSVLTEGLQTIPTFGSLIKWPITNQKKDLNLTCNSQDAIVIDIKVDFLYMPNAANIYELTLKFKDFDGYTEVVTAVTRSSVRTACGDFTARQFQTNRAAVSQKMEDYVRQDMEQSLFSSLFQLNLRNIERPIGYQDAVAVSEAALADIELAKKEKEQQIIKATTILEDTAVQAKTTIDVAETDAAILVATAVQEIKLSALADIDLATAQRNQLITQAKTGLKIAGIEANKTLAAARTEAAVINAFAQSQFDALLNKYMVYAGMLLQAQTNHNLTLPATLAYFGNTIIGKGGTLKVALSAPANFAYTDEL
mmetsp:Transcript_24197/g.38981  ORF Transcript_24197/g.38981 Transcript_24197/m.38981 type:complete len:422 (+) Transcript_24197:4-1269(+)